MTQPSRYSYSRTGTSQPRHIVPLATGTSNLTLSDNICRQTGPRYLHLPAAPSKQVHHTWISSIYEDFITFYEANFATARNSILFAEFVGLKSTRIRQYKYFIAFLFYLYSTYFRTTSSRPTMGAGAMAPGSLRPTILRKVYTASFLGLTTTVPGPTVLLRSYLVSGTV